MRALTTDEVLACLPVSTESSTAKSNRKRRSLSGKEMLVFLTVSPGIKGLRAIEPILHWKA